MSNTALLEIEARNERVPTDFVDFCKHLTPQFPRHLEDLAALLGDVDRGEIGRLLVTPFPSSGASTLLARFAAWYLARNPGKTIFEATASTELAVHASRAVRGLFAHDRWPYETGLVPTTSPHELKTTHGSTFHAIGACEITPNRRADLVVCDSVQNSYSNDAQSAELEAWFRDVLQQHVNPGAAIVVFQGRVGPNDLAGRLINASDGHLWRVVRLPALSGANDATWPERWPVSELMRMRAEIGTRAFETMWQVNPEQQGD